MLSIDAALSMQCENWTLVTQKVDVLFYLFFICTKDIAAETGLEHCPMADGQLVAGIYRRSVMLASGRYAMLDDAIGFSLLPWKPAIENG